MAKKPRVVYDPRIPLPPFGRIAIDTVKATAPRIISGAVVDPVIMALRFALFDYSAELKLTKKRKKPLSRD